MHVDNWRMTVAVVGPNAIISHASSFRQSRSRSSSISEFPMRRDEQSLHHTSHSTVHSQLTTFGIASWTSKRRPDLYPLMDASLCS